MRGLELGADDYLVKPFAFSARLAPAVAASASVPILYQPIAIGGRLLVDGARTAAVPVDAERELGADVVIAVDVAYRPYEDTDPERTLIRAGEQAVRTQWPAIRKTMGT